VWDLDVFGFFGGKVDGWGMKRDFMGFNGGLMVV